MATIREMRKAARTAIRGKWFWRLFLVLFAAQGTLSLVAGLLNAYNQKCEVSTFSDYLAKKMSAIGQGMDYTLPTMSDYWNMFAASGLQLLLSLVVGAILAVAIAVITTRAVRRQNENWLSDACAGLRSPFEMTLLMLSVNAVVSLGFFLFIIPGIVAIYRYRLVWFLKADHPDWGIGQCLHTSGDRMRGRKWKAFLLDLSYLPQIVLASAVMGISALCGAADSTPLPVRIVTSVLSFAMLALIVSTVVTLMTSRAVFYREVLKETDSSCPAAS